MREEPVAFEEDFEIEAGHHVVCADVALKNFPVDLSSLVHHRHFIGLPEENGGQSMLDGDDLRSLDIAGQDHDYLIVGITSELGDKAVHPAAVHQRVVAEIRCGHPAVAIPSVHVERWRGRPFHTRLEGFVEQRCWEHFPF